MSNKNRYVNVSIFSYKVAIEGKESIPYYNFSLSSSNKSVLVDTEEKDDIRSLEELNCRLDYDDADIQSCLVAGKKIPFII